MVEAFSKLFRAHFDAEPDALTALAGDGSQRRYVRMTHRDGTSVIGAYGHDLDENRAFLSIAETLRGAGVAVPRVLRVASDGHAYLLQDLGDTTLFRALESARKNHASSPFTTSILAHYEQALDLLVAMQLGAAKTLDTSRCYPRATFDRQSMRWDVDYFKYCFLKLAHIPFHEARLEDDLQALLARLEAAPASFFLHRDFQSRNLMLHDDRVWTIDFQGGRHGPLHYDIAALLFDGKAAMPPDVREQLLEAYVDRLRAHDPALADDVSKRFYDFVLLRILQAMGAYGYLGIHQRKPHFVQSIPHAVTNLGWLHENTPIFDASPELTQIVARLRTRWPHAPRTHGSKKLHVHVLSFSYRVGAPWDPSGHGGGYTFDCRLIENPGRQASMRTSTGLDENVHTFLRGRPDVEGWFAHVLDLSRRHIAAYQARGFRNLSIHFGCTGGQHRSVYFAERLAALLRSSPLDVSVSVEHAERERWPT